LNRVFDGEVVHQFEHLGLGMGKHFSELEIDQFVEAWLSRYPDALERARKILDQGAKYDRKLMARNMREKLEIASTLGFFLKHREKNPTAYSDLEFDAMDRVRSLLSK
jgi:hypothetical protein